VDVFNRASSMTKHAEEMLDALVIFVVIGVLLDEIGRSIGRLSLASNHKAAVEALAGRYAFAPLELVEGAPDGRGQSLNNPCTRGRCRCTLGRTSHS
jgi:hypothetical protein